MIFILWFSQFCYNNNQLYQKQKMGSCMSADKRQDELVHHKQLEVTRCATEPHYIDQTQTCDRISPQSARLDKVKSKLPPLKKGIEQRQKLIAKSSNSTKDSRTNSGKIKDTKLLPNEQIKNLEINLKRQLQLSQSQIYRQKFATLSTVQNISNDDINCKIQDLKNSNLFYSFDLNQNSKDILENKQHNCRNEYATHYTDLSMGKENIRPSVK